MAVRFFCKVFYADPRVPRVFVSVGGHFIAFSVKSQLMSGTYILPATARQGMDRRAAHTSLGKAHLPEKGGGRTGKKDLQIFGAGGESRKTKKAHAVFGREIKWEIPEV
jgi:hypothetical protein